VAWETFKSLVSFPVLAILCLLLGWSALFALHALNVPLVREYFGILVFVVLVALPVVLVLYAESRQKREGHRKHARKKRGRLVRVASPFHALLCMKFLSGPRRRGNHLR
jgi:hypothetical protein